MTKDVFMIYEEDESGLSMPVRRSKRSSVEQRSQRKAKIVAVFVTRITFLRKASRVRSLASFGNDICWC